MSEELKYHYENPKFTGKPWTVDKKQKHANQRRKWRPTCVKKPYATEQEAAKETAKLTVEEHKDFFGRLFRWEYGFCGQCDAWHVIRVEK